MLNHNEYMYICRSYSLIVGLEAVVESKASHARQTAFQYITAAKTLSIVKLLVDVVYGGPICRLIHLYSRWESHKEQDSNV